MKEGIYIHPTIVVCRRQTDPSLVIHSGVDEETLVVCCGVCVCVCLFSPTYICLILSSLECHCRVHGSHTHAVCWFRWRRWCEGCTAGGHATSRGDRQMLGGVGRIMGSSSGFSEVRHRSRLR